MELLYRTARLCVRAWDPSDGAALAEAVAESREHLRPWLPWADEPPRPTAESEALLAAFARDFAAGQWWGYGLFARDGAGCERRVLGGLGVHRPRHPDQPPSTREIGYWLRATATGRGYMTEAVGAVADAVLAEPGVLAVEVRVDPANAPSARVPERLGFALRARLVGNRAAADGGACDTLVWERRAPTALRPAAPADVPRLAEIRAAVRENRLATPGFVTEGDYLAAIARGTCWVWEDAAGVHGFASGAPHDDAHVWALFVDPAAEGNGVGSALLARLTDELWSRGHRRLRLETGSGTRAEQLYRAAGWTEVGRAEGGDVAFERVL
jgi:RimJ/RimL family protein N-acetyltransferase